jgi:hypothetical protein
MFDKGSMLNWDTDIHDLELISNIADRFIEIAKHYGKEFPKMDLVMDIEATHNNGCPLRLAALLEANYSELVHDVIGIWNNLDRETGQLKNCFQPRYARPVMAG